MAEIKFKYEKNNKKHLTLGDCKIGDIVRLHKNKTIYIITSITPSVKLVSMLDLHNVEFKNYDDDTFCEYYTEPLLLNESAFQEYVN